MAWRDVVDSSRMNPSATALPFVPADPCDHEWDVVVIGTGMGGGTIGYELARRGHDVLFLEKGEYLFDPHERSAALVEPEAVDERLALGRWPHRIAGDVDDLAFKMFPSMGCGTGGSSSLFAAQLERMLPSDFVPAATFGPVRTGSSAPERWPIAYEQLAPYYRRAEAIYEVVGTPDPCNPDPEQALGAPPALSERDEALCQLFAGVGLHPYRAHVGCRYVPECTGCGGVLCPKDCKSDAGRVCVRPAVSDHQAKLLSRAEVTRLEATGSTVHKVHYCRDGVAGWVRAKFVVLAAGAMISPAVLLRSTSDASPDGLANRSGQVGRNLMMHTSDFVALQPPADLSADGPAKALSCNDFYVHGGVKLGTFQSVGMPINRGVIEFFLKSRARRGGRTIPGVGAIVRKVAARIGARLFRSAVVFSSVIEDLPYSHNRILLDPQDPNGMRFAYQFPDELRWRNERMREALRRRLPGNVGMLVLTGERNLNFGHVSGTCRMGDDPETSVVDADQRCHDLDNLYVADASVFPTSGGINPSLTIAALALRVADRISARLPATLALRAG
ncbi:MAG: GMC family oxidoreductase [Myxococcales bacterium FL481]|nr:MAG: GMC family oxidoreductase [Myxococcales bacterium FL481]